jgi:hypothetical protein
MFSLRIMKTETLTRVGFVVILVVCWLTLQCVNCRSQIVMKKAASRSVIDPSQKGELCVFKYKATP